MKFKLIPGWQDKNLTCIYCGTKRSVKYAVISSGASVPCCNKCVADMFDDDFESNSMEDIKDEDA